MYALGLAASIAAIVGTSHQLDAASVVRAVFLIVVLFALAVLALAWLGRRTKRRRRSFYAVRDDEWMSRLGYYLGPYDASAGLDGSREFFERHSPFGKQPQGYLIATNDHLAIAAADRPFEAIVVPYVEIDRIDLFPGTKERKAMITPGRAHLLGQVLISTREGRKAGFAGTPVDALSRRLTDLGASIVRADGSSSTDQ